MIRFYVWTGSDKRINVYHLFTGEHVATLFGHSDLVTGLLFLPDLRHLVSVSCDSCLLVWRLAPELTQQMLERRARVHDVMRGPQPVQPSTGGLPSRTPAFTLPEGQLARPSG